MKKHFVTILILIASLSLFAQKKKEVTDYLKTVKVASLNTNFDFTPEWQYISSDLYLFNTEKFSDVINSIITGKKIHWWSRKRYDLQNILITMQTKGLGQYDNITFPLFNFVIERDPDKGYKVTAETNEVLRIVDNYPAPAVKDFISAKVDVQVITKDNQVKVYKLAASQLETISMLVTNPSDAIVKLVGEFGKMIESVADKKEFHFTSTIRIYQNENFNQQLHSIVVFAFVPSTENEFKINVDLSDLKKLLSQNPNPKIDRKFLYKYIRIKKYPYVVIVNYKSKYVPDVPEDIDFDVIKSREVKLESDYKKGMISPQIYELEKELLGFLKKYAQLQLDLNNYFLNLQNQTTEDYSKFYYFILRDIWNLKNYYRNVLSLRADNKLFKEDFQQYYEKFLKKAEISLNQNLNLQNIKKLADLLYYLENTNPDKIATDSASLENYLNIINSVKLPQSEKNTPIVQLVDKWRKDLEQIYYIKYFQNHLEQLERLPVNDSTYEIVVNFQTDHSKTNCLMCKQQLDSFVKDFLKKYHQYKIEQAQQQFEQLSTKTKLDLIDITKKITCARDYLDNYPGKKPDYLQLIQQDLLRIDNQRQTLLSILNRNYVFTSAADIDKVMSDIKNLSEKIKTGLNAICQQEQPLCTCQNRQQQPLQDSLNQSNTQIKQDSLDQKNSDEPATIEQLQNSSRDTVKNEQKLMGAGTDKKQK